MNYLSNKRKLQQGFSLLDQLAAIAEERAETEQNVSGPKSRATMALKKTSKSQPKKKKMTAKQKRRQKKTPPKAIKVLIRDSKHPAFCQECTGTFFQVDKPSYHVVKADGANAVMPACDVYPMEPPLHACSSSVGEGDVGRQIAVCFLPENIPTWYCGTIEQWRASKGSKGKKTKGQRAQSTLGIHGVRFEANDELKQIYLDQETVVWMSSPRNGTDGGSSSSSSSSSSFRNASPFLELSDGDNSFVAIQHLAHSPLPGPRDIHVVGSQTTRGAPRAILTARSRI